MHEYSIVQSLVDSVAAAVDDRQSCLSPSVHNIHVAIGELAGVDCTLLATAFEVFREGTLCEHATLTIDRVFARWECSHCGVEMPRGGYLRCALCNSSARLAAGDEIVLQRIELEVA